MVKFISMFRKSRDLLNFNSSGLLLDYNKLYRIAENEAIEYKTADPYPHIMIEDLVDPSLAHSLERAIAHPKQNVGWRQIEAKVGNQKAQFNKLGMANQLAMAPLIRQLINELNSGPFLQFLERVTGIEHLLPDPSLQGGGVHQILPGGVLGVHADFTRHKIYDLDRRLNLLLYLNSNWKPEYGGHLELWTRDLSACRRRISPNIGRCVIFTTDSTSYHGHPEPLASPQGVYRKSIALYYYTNGRSDNVAPTHRTDFQRVPDTPKPALE